MTLTLHCSRCGNSNFNYAQFCAACGTPLNWGAQQQTNNHNRAIIALVLGVVGILFCGFTAIPGAILAWLEMQVVREGRAPQSNGGMAKVAFGVNIVALILTVFAVLLMGLFGVVLR